MRKEENLKRRKKTIIILSIIAVILVVTIAILAVTFTNIRKNNNNKNEIENKDEEVIENTEEIEQEEQTEEINEEDNENTEINGIVDDEIDYIDPRVGVDKETLQKEKEKEKKEEANIEKAKEIVRKDWGNDSSVSIVYDNYRDDMGRYVIKIRDKQTHEIATYHVNIDNGTFEKQITKGDF